jgi:Ca2+/Na+ antiporter
LEKEMNDIKILFELYKEQRDLGLHHEDQRAKVTGLMFTVATILIGLVAFDKTLTIIDLPAVTLIITLGIFGALFSLKHYERFTFHRKRSRILRDAIDAALRAEELNDSNSKKVRDEIRRKLNLDQKKSEFLIESIVKKSNKLYKKKNKEKSKEEKKKKSKNSLKWIRLNLFWTLLHVIVSIIGIVLLASIVIRFMQ